MGRPDERSWSLGTSHVEAEENETKLQLNACRVFFLFLKKKS